MRSGAAAAEFALIVPVLSLFMFGVLELGLGIYTNNAMATAARNGARLIAFGSTAPEAEAAARAELPSWVRTVATITSTPDDAGMARVFVQVPGASASIIGLVPVPKTLFAEGTMPRVNDR